MAEGRGALLERLLRSGVDTRPWLLGLPESARSRLPSERHQAVGQASAQTHNAASGAGLRWAIDATPETRHIPDRK